MSRDSTVIAFRQPDDIDDPLTELAREAPMTIATDVASRNAGILISGRGQTATHARRVVPVRQPRRFEHQCHLGGGPFTKTAGQRGIESSEITDEQAIELRGACLGYAGHICLPAQPPIGHVICRDVECTVADPS